MRPATIDPPGYGYGAGASPRRWEEYLSVVGCLAVVVARKKIGALVGHQLPDGVVSGWGGRGWLYPWVKCSGPVTIPLLWNKGCRFTHLHLARAILYSLLIGTFYFLTRIVVCFTRHIRYQCQLNANPRTVISTLSHRDKRTLCPPSKDSPPIARTLALHVLGVSPCSINGVVEIWFLLLLWQHCSSNTWLLIFRPIHMCASTTYTHSHKAIHPWCSDNITAAMCCSTPTSTAANPETAL